MLEQELAPAFPYSFPAHMHGVSTTDQIQAVIDHYTSPTRQVVRKVVAASQTFVRRSYFLEFPGHQSGPYRTHAMAVAHAVKLHTPDVEITTRITHP